MRSAQLAGYLLEEVIAHLLKSSGYRILSAEDDEAALVRKGNGLRVRGRGAEHQADALGALTMTIPFSLPIRLFVEAKNVASKIGLDVIRNAHGVVHDVNEFRGTDATVGAARLRQVQYRYSIFSTSGFTRDAQDFALAHQISLIDLSGPAWDSLSEKLRAGARVFLRLPAGADAAPQARFHLRAALQAIEPSPNDPAHTDADADADMAKSFAEWARQLATTVLQSEAGEGDLLLGFVDAPFILALRLDEGDAFRRLARDGEGRIDVHIGYDRQGPLGGDWVVQAVQDPEAFRITFPLPGVLEELLLGVPEDGVRGAASQAKRMLMPTVTVYVDEEPVVLRYRRMGSTPAVGVPESARDSTPLRYGSQPLAAKRSVHVELSSDQLVPGRWTVAAVRALLERLREGEYVQEALIRFAAEHGGVIDRANIYRVASFEAGRTLRGLARPTNRIRRELIDEGALPDDAVYPFEAAYAAGVVASGYFVPEEVAAVVRRLG